MSTIGPEYCKRYYFGENKSWGITAQLGIGKVLSTDPEFKKELLKQIKKDKLPAVYLTYGIGISF